QARVDPVRLVSLVRQRPELTLVPPAGLKLNLDGSDTRARPEGTAKRSPVPPSPGRGRTQAAPPTWWVARARESEVKPGFTKAELTRPATEDPRASGGIFERVGGLLSDLIDQS